MIRRNKRPDCHELTSLDDTPFNDVPLNGKVKGLKSPLFYLRFYAKGSLEAD